MDDDPLMLVAIVASCWLAVVATLLFLAAPSGFAAHLIWRALDWGWSL